MPTSSMRKGKKRNEHGLLSLVLACGILLLAYIASAQIYLPKPAPEPSEYGKVILDNYPGTEPGAVVFDHWLHRSKFTCRVCHVDVGFAMEAKATGINAKTNHEGFHCGACHDGKKVFDGKTIFAACSDSAHSAECDQCHSLGKQGVRKYEYKEFTAKLPKGIYGVNWEAAEKTGAIKPVDFVEGISVRTDRMQNRKDFSVEAAMPWVSPIFFSHEKHSIWNGCELCHPEIFPTAQKGALHFSMFSNIEGQYCGACHRKVAFPLNNCQGCHPRAPLWVP
ncbi:MAG: c(7)-type cytochrome triheme domain-containing protein [Terriglobales bacterium]